MPIEERLISPRHVFQSIWTVSSARDQFIVIEEQSPVPVNLDTTVIQLPQKMSETTSSPLNLPKKNVTPKKTT